MVSRHYKLLTLIGVVIFVVVGAGVFFVKQKQTASAATAAPQTTAVRKGVLVVTVATTGAVQYPTQAKLQFPTSGTVLSVPAQVGLSVTKDQVLAKMDDKTLQLAVLKAQSDLGNAQTSLKDYLDGFSDVQILKTKASVTSAQAGLLKAPKDLANYKSTGAATAQAAVAKAQTDSQTAKVALDLAKSGAPGNAVRDAQDALTKAKADLQNTQTNNELSLAQAQRALKIAEDAYKDLIYRLYRLNFNTPQLLHADLTVYVTPFLLQTQDTVIIPLNVLDAWNAASDTLKRLDVTTTQNTTSLTTAQKTVALTQQTLDTAFAADPNNLQSRQIAYDQAQTTLFIENENVRKADAGLDPIQMANLTAGVDNAVATVAIAQDNLAKLQAGPDPNKKNSLDTSIANAQQQLQVAKDNLAAATMKAPFDGIVSTVNVSVGDTNSVITTSGGGTGAGIVMIDPKSAQVNATVDEIDVTSLKVGMPVALKADSLPGKTIQGKLASIAPVATVTQGVASYSIAIEFLNPADSALVRGGMSMNAQIVTVNKQGVLLVPVTALQTSGRGRTVQVMENGVATPKTVTVGSTNAQVAEITDGVKEGDLVIIPTRTTTTAGANTTRIPGVGGFGGPGGGGVFIGGGPGR